MGPDELARAVTGEGYVVLPDVLAPATVASWTGAIDRSFERARVGFGANEFLGLRTRRLFNLLARDDVFAEVPLQPAVLEIVERVLDEECLLSSLTAIEMNPGETAQPLHADDGSFALPKPHGPITCTAILALTDFTLENGATRIVAGSHERPSPRRGGRAESPETLNAVMRAGSVLLYHGSLWHGGGANRSDARRLAIVCNYCAGFLRQEECQLLALPREAVARYPSRLRRLVGYSTYRGLLGHVDQSDPESLLDPRVETEMVWGRIGNAESEPRSEPGQNPGRSKG